MNKAEIESFISTTKQAHQALTVASLAGAEANLVFTLLVLNKSSFFLILTRWK